MKRVKYMWSLLLALPLLWVSNGVLATVGGSATPFFPAGTLTVGEGPLNARIELVATGDDFPATLDAGTIKLTISCGTNSDPWNCPVALVETGVLSIDDTTAVAGGSANPVEICNGVTFSFGAPDATTGEILITPSVPLTFPDPNDLCTINLQVNVDGVPANDASAAAGLQTAQGAEFRLTNSVQDAGGGVGADTTTIAACSVEVDKQVCCDTVCDSDDDWVDVGYDDNAADSCNGLEDDLINIRYLARNTGTNCPLTNCSLAETNDVFDTSPGGTFALGDGAATSPPIDNSPQDCSDAFGTPGGGENEPDKVTVTCDTPFQTQVDDEDEAAFACLTVDLLVDRNVDCDGVGVGDAPADKTLTRNDSDGQLGCTANDGDDIFWGYQYCNNGTAPLYDCRLTDDNTNVSVPIDVGNLAPETCAAPLTGNPTGDPEDCSTQLEADELANGQVNLSCCTRDVANLEDCAAGDRQTVYDRSKVECLTQSGLEITKVCDDDDGDGTDDTAIVTVAAGAGDLGFTDCTVSDTIYLDNPTCSENPPGTVEGTPLDVPLSNAAYNLAPVGEEVSEGTFALNDADACNTAQVSCTPESGGAPVEEAAAPVICDFQEEGCITHSPGYWGTHPNAAAALLDIEVCGETLASVEPNEVSTTEAMCSVGQDGKILGAQVTQLLRQCTAAALNHAVSEAEGGGCTHAEEEIFADCCGAAIGEGNYCSGQDAGSLGVSACIDLLDEFNNSLDTQQTDWFDAYNPADPTKCKDSKNNGYQPFAPGLSPPPKPGKGPK